MEMGKIVNSESLPSNWLWTTGPKYSSYTFTLLCTEAALSPSCIIKTRIIFQVLMVLLYANCLPRKDTKNCSLNSPSVVSPSFQLEQTCNMYGGERIKQGKYVLQKISFCAAVNTNLIHEMHWKLTFEMLTQKQNNVKL